MQQHNNVSSLSANGGKEKSGSKSNGNADFEINLYQENSNNMETAEKSRGTVTALRIFVSNLISFNLFTSKQDVEIEQNKRMSHTFKQ